MLLFWFNPPENAYDNHFEPIFWILRYGTIAPKDALWQSYQPPVFYVISALVGKLAMTLGVSVQHIPKVLHFMPCLYGILTLGITNLILQKIPLSKFSRLLAFGFACFLPQNIYMSAIHSNDTISALFVAICIYLMFLTIEKKFPLPVTILLCIVITITIFTKYTAFVVIPMALLLILACIFKQVAVPRKKWIGAFLLLIVIPLLFLGTYCFSNIQKYKCPLPWNSTILTPAKTQPRADGGLCFTDFKPWETIAMPILTPWNTGSFWTLIYSRMWFDMEPKFVFFIEQDVAWWSSYVQWLRGEKPFPSDVRMAPSAHFTGSTLILFGLVPLLFIMVGVCRSIFEAFSIQNRVNKDTVLKNALLLVLLAFNAVGVIALTLKSPVFSSVKASYFLGSIPALSAFLGLGIMTCEKYQLVRRTISFISGGLFALSTFHILHICVSILCVLQRIQ